MLHESSGEKRQREKEEKEMKRREGWIIINQQQSRS